MEDSFWKNTFESWLLCEIPFFLQDLERNILVGGASFEFYDAIVWIICILQVILRSFLFIVEIWIKYVKFITLNCFWGWVGLSEMEIIVLVPLTRNSNPIYIDRFCIPKPSFSLARDPIVKILFIFLHSFKLLKLNNLFCYLVIGTCLIGDYFSTEQVMVMRNWQIYL